MKKLLLKYLFITVIIMYTQVSYAQQNLYVDLQPASPITNPVVKTGWNIVIQDEFNGTKSSIWRDGYCWGNAHPSDPYYNRDANYVQNPTSISFITKKEDYTAPGNSILKHYTSAMINSDACTGDTIPLAGRTIKYGYIEARIKNPNAQLGWPAFWLFGEKNSKSIWNELDVFEFGVNDGLVMTNHWQAPNSAPQSIGQWVYSMPGQTFGATWVTYALKWEPNKLVWYINNVPVRVQTNANGVIIPSTAMRVKVNSGCYDLYTPYTLNLPQTFPNAMEVDYVRVYQRPDYSLPDPIFTINNKQSYNSTSPIMIPFTSGLPIFLNGAQSYMPNNYYFLSVQTADLYGNLYGKEAQAWLSSADLANISNYNITAFAAANGLILKGGNYYRVKLAGSPWHEINQYIYLNYSCTTTINFKLNGQTTTYPQAIPIAYSGGKPRVILDASTTISCNNAYFISVQGCDVNGNPTGTEIQKWLSASEAKYIAYFDVENFCNQNNFPLNYGNYYRVKFASGPTFTEKVQIIHINSCSNNVSFSINGQSNSMPSAINIGNGEDILLDGSGSKFCINAYFVSILQCDAGGIPIPSAPEISEWKPYMGYDAVNQIYYYGIGRYDIKDLCRRNNYDLGCGKYYRIKLAANPPWLEVVKMIYITPCTNVNNTYQINNVDAPSYNFGDPNNMSVNLYAPLSVSCDEEYFVSVQKRLNGTLVGTEAQQWLSLTDIYNLRTLGIFDLKAFAQDPNHDGNYSDGITLTNNTTYRVKLVAGAGTCNTNTWVENNKIIYFGTGSNRMGIDEDLNLDDRITKSVQVYPNPANETLFISLPYENNKANLTLLDTQGKVVKTSEINERLEIINVSELLSGIYILKIMLPDMVYTKKIEIIK